MTLPATVIPASGLREYGIERVVAQPVAAFAPAAASAEPVRQATPGLTLVLTFDRRWPLEPYAAGKASNTSGTLGGSAMRFSVSSANPDITPRAARRAKMTFCSLR